jgi:hypothetical protein
MRSRGTRSRRNTHERPSAASTKYDYHVSSYTRDVYTEEDVGDVEDEPGGGGGDAVQDCVACGDVPGEEDEGSERDNERGTHWIGIAGQLLRRGPSGRRHRRPTARSGGREARQVGSRRRKDHGSSGLISVWRPTATADHS